ncbi:histidyl-tRNA synthetase [Paenibacillus sp. W4I10]|uniref:ABC-three component system middle component 1 n=1 Tax=Paenibacillus sp. W4I10 TaxID=3042298 RepID=UPI002787DEFB|nr:ABC-three component system middle component 1 [Paenibacillus sp. W4I10]MDQ0721911.1 histidyl-tRNA synthetase [Paenibacillus sp. W4I10]
MDIFNTTHNRLLDNGFAVYYSKEIEALGASFYKSTINNVVLKKLHYDEELSLIRTFSWDLRSILMEGKENIWNTYVLFCVDDEIDFETIYKIERDTKSLRKYAICSELDLNRIPFLDEYREIKKPTKNDVVVGDGNEYLKEIIHFIEESDGRQNKLTVDQLNALMNKIINMVELRYENRQNNS